MKFEITLTEHYLLICSELQIKDARQHYGKYHLEKGYIINKFPTYLTDLSECKIIKFHLPINGAPILDGVQLLPDLSNDAGRLAEADLKDIYPKFTPIHKLSYIKGIERGYNAATKIFSEEELRSLVNSVTEFMSHNEPEEFDDWFEKKIQRLKESKYPKYFVAVTEDAGYPTLVMEEGVDYYCDQNSYFVPYIVKTETDIHGQTVLTGTYQ